MDYKESNEIPSSEESGDADLPTIENLEQELEFEGETGSGETEEAIPNLDRKSKAQQPGSRFSLQARRAIEDHLDQRRLHKELDYLFDDKFIEGKGKEGK